MCLIIAQYVITNNILETDITIYNVCLKYDINLFFNYY